MKECAAVIPSYRRYLLVCSSLVLVVVFIVIGNALRLRLGFFCIDVDVGFAVGSRCWFVVGGPS